MKKLWFTCFILSLGITTMAQENTLTATTTGNTIFTDGSFKKNPQLTPKEAVEGALKVVEDLSNGIELSPELILEKTGIILIKREPKNNYDYGVKLNEYWNYFYRLILDPSFQNQKFSFDFSPRGKEPSMTTICEIDVNAIHTQLLEMGFTFQGMQRRGLRENEYKKNHLFIRLAYQGESNENPSHHCMRNMIISISKLKE